MTVDEHRFVSNPEQVTKQPTPHEVSSFIALVKGGHISLTSQELIINGTKYSEWGNNAIPNTIPVGGNESLRIITEGSLRSGSIAVGEVAFSNQFHDCTAIILRRENQVYFLHNSGDEVSAETRAQVIAALDPDVSLTNQQQVMHQIIAQRDENLLRTAVFDEIIIVAKYPIDIAAYFAQATRSLTVHNVQEQEGIGKTDTFSVWVTNEGNGVLWGVLPALT